MLSVNEGTIQSSVLPGSWCGNVANPAMAFILMACEIIACSWNGSDCERGRPSGKCYHVAFGDLADQPHCPVRLVCLGRDSNTLTSAGELDDCFVLMRHVSGLNNTGGRQGILTDLVLIGS